jgi:hypothetical protein
LGYLCRREDKVNKEVNNKNGRNRKIKPRTINKMPGKKERTSEKKRRIRKHWAHL